MSNDLPGIVITILGLLFGLGILTLVEIYVLQWLEIAEKPKSVKYSLFSNLITGLIVGLGFALLVIFVFAGLIVAMDKGYDSAKVYLTVAVAAPTMIPVLMIAVRLLLFRLYDLGSFGKGFLYSLVSSGIITFSSFVIILVFLAVSSSLGLI